jgi:hypothetical protein
VVVVVEAVQLMFGVEDSEVEVAVLFAFVS